jgi:ubiquinone/menaquinone biosynthesis C-methylase UbiE
MGFTDKGKNFEPSVSDSINVTWELFDGQAAAFDQRAGLPAEYCRSIAKAVIDIGEVEPGDLIIEVGPGTGQIGQWFIAPIRYVGMDLSAGMLSEFSRRAGDNLNNRMLIRADANRRWPLIDRTARVIFSSRAIHLLDHEHVASEVFRSASPSGATLVIGRIEREFDSVRARMAREMNERLRQHGFEGHRGEQQNRKLIESCRQRGAQVLEPVSVAKWKAMASPRQSLDSWRSLKSLGGIPVPATIREKILTELEVRAQEIFGGLDKQLESEENYVLKGLRISPAF